MAGTLRPGRLQHERQSRIERGCAVPWAYTKSDWQDRFLWRVFAIGYHDGRTGITKTDNRPLPVRQADHQNIRVGTYGGDFLNHHPRRAGTIRFRGLGCIAKRPLGKADTARAPLMEGGYRFLHVASTPWLRGVGGEAAETTIRRQQAWHIFRAVATPRDYARFPNYDLMNLRRNSCRSSMPQPSGSCAVTCTGCSLVQPRLWYQGGGAYDNKVSVTRAGRATDSSLSPALSISVQTGAPRLIWTLAGFILMCGARGCPAASIPRAAMPSLLFWSWFSTRIHR